MSLRSPSSRREGEVRGQPRFYDRDLEEQETLCESEGGYVTESGGSMKKRSVLKNQGSIYEAERREEFEKSGKQAMQDSYMKEMEMARVKQRRIDEAFQSYTNNPPDSSPVAGRKVRMEKSSPIPGHPQQMKPNPSGRILSPPLCFSNAQQLEYASDNRNTTINTSNRSPCGTQRQTSRQKPNFYERNTSDSRVLHSVADSSRSDIPRHFREDDDGLEERRHLLEFEEGVRSKQSTSTIPISGSSSSRQQQQYGGSKGGQQHHYTRQPSQHDMLQPTDDHHHTTDTKPTVSVGSQYQGGVSNQYQNMPVSPCHLPTAQRRASLTRVGRPYTSSHGGSSESEPYDVHAYDGQAYESQPPADADNRQPNSSESSVS